MAFSRHAGNLDCFETMVLCLFAIFAAFWRVLELFVAIESLLTGGPDKRVGAVKTRNDKVFEFAS